VKEQQSWFKRKQTRKNADKEHTRLDHKVQPTAYASYCKVDAVSFYYSSLGLHITAYV